MDDKIVVTNRSALVKKYGKTGFAAISAALKALIAADKKRGLTTKIVYLDQAASMKKMGGVAVVTATDPRENKDAIDAVYRTRTPDYLMILGAVDVVPHQDLNNATGDDDTTSWGDLPYACEARYSRDPAAFVGPTRVVGRLPDLTKATDPAYIVSLLKIATGYTARPADKYSPYFGLSADVWKGSTKLSLSNIFGSSTALLLAPPAGPNYPASELHSLSHFINCHGAEASPEFYGQRGNSMPVSLTTASLGGQVKEGTIAAAECCYGAQLYDSITLGLDMPICQSYLAQGTYGYFGSTTIAYGPADGNGAADLICQFYLINILQGASVGRAALMARQQYVSAVAQMDPIDLKTLSQFNLLGDPSIHPVSIPKTTSVLKTLSNETNKFVRTERRAKLKMLGDFLTSTKATASKKSPLQALTSTLKTALSGIAKQAGLDGPDSFTAFSVKLNDSAKALGAKVSVAPTRYFVAVSEQKTSNKGTGALKGVAVIAKESGGRIVDYRIYERR